jgi:putative membrane protein
MTRSRTEPARRAVVLPATARAIGGGCFSRKRNDIVDRRNMLLGSAGIGLAAFSLTLPLRAALAQTSHWLSGSEHLAQTLMGGTLAKQASELALQRSQFPQVRQFAQFEIAEQTVLAQVLTDVANPPPVTLDAQHAAVLQTLQAQTGPAFDRAYVLSQIQGHQELLQVQQGYLDNTARTTDRQHIAALARMTIQQHLAMLADLQRVATG